MYCIFLRDADRRVKAFAGSLKDVTKMTIRHIHPLLSAVHSAASCEAPSNIQPTIKLGDQVSELVVRGGSVTASLAENPRFPQGKLVALVVHEVHEIKILRGNY